MGITKLTIKVIKREDAPTVEEVDRIVDALGRSVLKDIWDSLETEEERAYFRSINGALFEKEHKNEQ